MSTMAINGESFGYDGAHEAAQHIGEECDKKNLKPPRIAVTLGSGLKSFVDRYTRPDSRLVIPYEDIPHFAVPNTHVAGHDGKLVIAPLDGTSGDTMAIWSGRIHYYQQLLRGRGGEKITDPEVKKAAIGFYIAICRAMGIDDIVTSNAVGSTVPGKYEIGDIVGVTDHILDPDDDFGVPEDSRWFDERMQADPGYVYGNQDFFYGQGNLYSDEIRNIAKELGKEMDTEVKEGILHWRKGRGYESPAMTEAIRRKGCDLAGMSTAPEAQRARTVGYSNRPGERHYGAFSVVTNVAQSTHDQVLDHGHVGKAAKNKEDAFNPFMLALLQRLHARRKQASPQDA